MSDQVTITPQHYDKLGVVHCGVVREGTVSCGGDIAMLDDGESHVFGRVGIVVRRDGSDYVFERV